MPPQERPVCARSGAADQTIRSVCGAQGLSTRMTPISRCAQNSLSRSSRLTPDSPLISGTAMSISPVSVYRPTTTRSLPAASSTRKKSRSEGCASARSIGLPASSWPCVSRRHRDRHSRQVRCRRSSSARPRWPGRAHRVVVAHRPRWRHGYRWSVRSDRQACGSMTAASPPIRSPRVRSSAPVRGAGRCYTRSTRPPAPGRPCMKKRGRMGEGRQEQLSCAHHA